MKKLIFAAAFLISTHLFADVKDPFENIEKFRLDNGMDVVLSPDPTSNLVQVKVMVGVGFVHEKEGQYGISHLLEHALFRNERLKDDMSYSELIKEKEGSANGTTSWDRTSYYATMKKENGEWLVKTFFDMITNPTLTDKYVETEKKTVLLEIGEPSPITKFIQFDVNKVMRPTYLRKKDFWEEYFNVQQEKSYTRTEEQLSVLKLKKSQLEQHYKQFYDPSNMQIIVSGSFKPQTMKVLIKNLWGSIKSKNIGDQRPKYVAKLEKKTYQDFDFGSGRSFITLGYMMEKLSAKETEVLNSYWDFLSHRLMKQIRNKNGETYTAYYKYNIKQDFGVITINFSTSKDRYHENYDLVKKMISDEMQSGKLSDENIEEAKRLYLNSFNLWGKDVNGSARLAETMFHRNEYYKTWTTPKKLLSPVTPQEYREILKKYSSPVNGYTSVKQPELFFYLDYVVLGAICLITFFIMFRRTLTQKFSNDQVKWVRKVKYPSLKLLELYVGGLIIFATMHTNYVVEKLMNNALYNSLGIYTEYIDTILFSLTMIATAQVIVSCCARKLYVMQDKLVIKSLSYYSTHVPLKHIKKVTTKNAFRFFFSKDLKNIFRCNFYNLKFWQPGLVIELNNGKKYFFSMKDAKASSAELKTFIPFQEEMDLVFDEAA